MFKIIIIVVILILIINIISLLLLLLLFSNNSVLFLASFFFFFSFISLSCSVVSQNKHLSSRIHSNVCYDCCYFTLSLH